MSMPVETPATSRNTLCWLVLLLVGVRIASLFFVEAIWPSLERFYAGTVAREMAVGLKMSLLDYPFSSYESGWLLAGLVCLPFMKIFGFTSFGMATAAVTLDVIQFVIFYLILARTFNPRVALIFGLQQIISPYIFFVTNVYVGFSYFDVPFTTAVFLALYFWIVQRDSQSGGLSHPGRWHFLLGAVAGFFTWVCFAFALLAIPCLAHWSVCVRRWDSRRLLSLLAGMVVGISPLFLRLISFADGIKSGILERVATHDASGFVANFLEVLRVKPEFAWSVFFQYMEWLGMFLFVMLVILKRKDLSYLIACVVKKNEKPTPQQGVLLIYILYIVTFMVVFCLSDFSNERYFQPMFPFVMGCNAIVIDQLMRNRRRVWQMVGIGALGLQLTLSVADCIKVPLFRAPANTQLFRDQAYSYELLGCLVSWRFWHDPPRVMKIIDQLKDSRERQALMRGFGFELAVESGGGPPVTDYIQYFLEHRSADKDLLRAFNVGTILGYGQQFYTDTYLAEFYPSALQADSREEAIKFVKNHIQLFEFEDLDRRSDLYKGLGLQFSAIAQHWGLTTQDVTTLIAPEHIVDFNHGMQLGQDYGYSI